MFSIAGHKIKIAGEDTGIGVYFVSVEDPAQRVKVTWHLGENGASKVIGVVPALGVGKWKVEIKMQFNGSSSSTLKSPQTIASAFTLTVSSPVP
jgi:hypothetical protein